MIDIALHRFKKGAYRDERFFIGWSHCQNKMLLTYEGSHCPCKEMLERLKYFIGDVMWGEEVFAEKCASCHGDFAEGVDNWPVLADGFDTLADEDPVKTVGSYWPHLSTAWDYIHRSMPFGAAGTLTVDETYATVAYILYSTNHYYRCITPNDFKLTFKKH